MHPALYYAWQYGGFVLGLFACAATGLFWDDDDPYNQYKLWAWVGLALVALLIHETRPYKVRHLSEQRLLLGKLAYGV